MKICCTILALSVFHTNVWGTAAFSINPRRTASSVSLRSDAMPGMPPPEPLPDLPEELTPDDMFPVYPKLDIIQGGGTVKTYQMPLWADRVQMYLTTNGRPMKASVELWVGPIRSVHEMNIDVEDGALTPYQATLKFKKLGQQLKITTSDSLELPIMAGVSVPSPERAAQLFENTERVWNMASPGEKQLIQGGSIKPQGGAAAHPGSVRSWNIPDNVASVQVIAWSKDSSKKSFKDYIEVLQGPNNYKQIYDLRCGGSTQPIHFVIQTPGEGWMIRIYNKKFVEDGLTEVAVVPYEVIGDGPAEVSAGPALGIDVLTGRDARFDGPIMP